MVVAVAKALEKQSVAIICASTGNTSASAAAYGALSGLRTIVIVPKGKIALGKFAQALVYGAEVIQILGNFDQALKIVRELIQKYPITLVNSINPHRIEGQKTAAFEIIDELGEAPDYLFIPVGNAGNITAYWRGFKEYYQIGKSKKLPRMMGFEAEGSAAIVIGEPIAEPETVASAIRIGNPASWQGAVSAGDESGGIIDWVGEPASAASLAGLIKTAEKFDFSNKKVVSIVTGSGLKDPDIIVQKAISFQEFPADLQAIEEALAI
jgi:threonine synthase